MSKRLIHNGVDPLSRKCDVVTEEITNAIITAMDAEFPGWRDKPAEPWALGCEALSDPDDVAPAVPMYVVWRFDIVDGRKLFGQIRRGDAERALNRVLRYYGVKRSAKTAIRRAMTR